MKNTKPRTPGKGELRLAALKGLGSGSLKNGTGKLERPPEPPEDDETSLAGLVMLPKREQHAFRHIEFLPLSEKRILVIWVVNDHDVQNRIVEVERPYTTDELQQMALYLNSHFMGIELEEIRERIIHELEQTKERANKLMLSAIAVAKQAFEDNREEPDIVLDGESNLFEYAEMANMEKLKQLFDAFNQKREMLKLLEGVSEADGVQIYIGEESGYKVFDGCSLVASPYQIDEEVMGVLGVIGPTRIQYQRVIPVVDMTAKILSAALNRP